MKYRRRRTDDDEVPWTVWALLALIGLIELAALLWINGFIRPLAPTP